MIVAPVALIYTSISKSSEAAAPPLMSLSWTAPSQGAEHTPTLEQLIFMEQVSERVNLHRALKYPYRVNQDTGRAHSTIKKKTPEHQKIVFLKITMHSAGLMPTGHIPNSANSSNPWHQ